jgi:hypothetical protein
MKTADYAENATILNTRTVALTGAAAWAGLALLARSGIARIGAIELLFSFAPLVIVPLGMELGTMIAGTNETLLTARRLQPAGAVLAVLSLCLPPGIFAGALAAVWMAVCSVAAFSGVIELIPQSLATAERTNCVHPDADEISTSGKSGQKWGTRNALRDQLSLLAIAVGRIDLAVGGAWLVASRIGLRPMGIQEPIGLLTAVHFHFAGFATATLAAATLHFSENHGRGRYLRWLVPFVIAMPFMIAVGFVTTPAIKMIAAVAFSVSVAGLAVFLLSIAGLAESKTARAMLRIASASVLAGMLVAAVFAVADFRGSDILPIPQMARTHGLLNAFGFCMCGLLGWLVEFNG